MSSGWTSTSKYVPCQAVSSRGAHSLLSGGGTPRDRCVARGHPSPLTAARGTCDASVVDDSLSHRTWTWPLNPSHPPCHGQQLPVKGSWAARLTLIFHPAFSAAPLRTRLQVHSRGADAQPCAFSHLIMVPKGRMQPGQPAAVGV